MQVRRRLAYLAPFLLPALSLLFVALRTAPASPPPPKEDAEVRHYLPQITSLFPQGSGLGTTLPLHLLGENLDRAQTVAFLNSPIRGRVAHAYHSRLELEFDVPADALPGLHLFRVITPRGASNLFPFRVGGLRHGAEKEPNNSSKQAQEVTLPVTLNGQLDLSEDFDFYRFHAEAGSTWIFDLRAGRNANPLDAALILLDSAGRKLDHAEDYFFFDPFIVHTFATTGSYLIVVQPTDDRFLDPNYGYQLDIRQAPYLQTVSPIALLPGTTTEVKVFGAGLLAGTPTVWFDESGFEGTVSELRGSSARLQIRVPPKARQGEHRLALATPQGRSNLATFLVDSTPPHDGKENITPPVSVTGMARYPDPERFFFEAKASQTLIFEVRAFRFGSPVDSFLRILNEKGEEIAKSDDPVLPGEPFNRDAVISHTFQEDGRYELQMRNVWSVDGENYPYQLIVRPARRSATLMLDTDQPYVHREGTGSLSITALREGGFEGPISLRVVGLPAGVTAEPAEIPARAKQGKITLRARAVPAATHSQIQVVSDEADGPAWRTVRIPRDGGDEATVTRVEQATLVVAEKPRFSVEALADSVTITAGRSAEVPLQIRRAANFDGALRLGFENLPPGVSFEPAVATRESTHVRIRLVAARDATPARSKHVVIFGTSEQGEVHCAPQITLSVE